MFYACQNAFGLRHRACTRDGNLHRWRILFAWNLTRPVSPTAYTMHTTHNTRIMHCHGCNPAPSSLDVYECETFVAIRTFSHILFVMCLCGLNYARFNCKLHSELCTRSQGITQISIRYAVATSNYINYKIVLKISGRH